MRQSPSNESHGNTLHKAGTRGSAEHGWLSSQHTFSFANYHDPQRMGFGMLRVINDDVVQPGMGFGTHPHRNMEIISIPLMGELRHQEGTHERRDHRDEPEAEGDLSGDGGRGPAGHGHRS